MKKQKQSNVWRKTIVKYCRPRSRLTGSQWADKYRYVAPGTSPEPGEWRTDRVPYLREPMDAATDKLTERVVMMFSSVVMEFYGNLVKTQCKAITSKIHRLISNPDLSRCLVILLVIHSGGQH